MTRSPVVTAAIDQKTKPRRPGTVQGTLDSYTNNPQHYSWGRAQIGDLLGYIMELEKRATLEAQPSPEAEKASLDLMASPVFTAEDGHIQWIPAEVTAFLTHYAAAVRAQALDETRALLKEAEELIEEIPDHIDNGDITYPTPHTDRRHIQLDTRSMWIKDLRKWLEKYRALPPTQGGE